MEWKKDGTSWVANPLPMVKYILVEENGLYVSCLITGRAFKRASTIQPIPQTETEAKNYCEVYHSNAFKS